MKTWRGSAFEQLTIFASGFVVPRFPFSFRTGSSRARHSSSSCPPSPPSADASAGAGERIDTYLNVGPCLQGCSPLRMRSSTSNNSVSWGSNFRANSLGFREIGGGKWGRGREGGAGRGGRRERENESGGNMERQTHVTDCSRLPVCSRSPIKSSHKLQ